MGELDGIGDAVTGAMLARAVEPDAGEANDGHTHEKACLNCGTPLTGAYCSACGQKAHVHRSLRAFMGDFVAGVLNFEGKFWRTVPMLVWCPGDLTRRYIGGERARFISPIALYLFSVFLMFAVLNFTGALDTDMNDEVKGGLQTAIAEDQKAIVKLEAERKTAAAAGKDLAAIDRKIAKHKADIAQVEGIQHGKIVTVDKSDGEVPAWISPWIERATNDPDLLALRMQEAASKYSWLLIPLSLPFMWLLFRFSRKFRLYDHPVFVTYSLSFMMMLVITGGLFVAFGWSGFAGMLFLLPPFHMYRQLKGAYQLGRFGTWWRTILLVTFAMIAGGIFFAFVAALGGT
jgi:hypothetical protein